MTAGRSMPSDGMNSRTKVLPLLLVVLGLFVAGGTMAACGAEAEQTGPMRPVPATDGPEERQVVIDLAGPAYLGQDFDPDTVAGRPIILWFWGAF